VISGSQAASVIVFYVHLKKDFTEANETFLLNFSAIQLKQNVKTISAQRESIILTLSY
jgi:hypothetical protein